VELQDQGLYALYGTYYSTASWKDDKPWLEKSQGRVSRDANARVMHRVFLGGDETAAALSEAQDRLQIKRKRHQPEKVSESPVVTTPATREEENVSRAASQGGAGQDFIRMSWGDSRIKSPTVTTPATGEEETGDGAASQGGVSRDSIRMSWRDSQIKLDYSMIRQQLAKLRTPDDIEKFRFSQNNKLEVNLIGNKNSSIDSYFLKAVGIEEKPDQLFILDMKNKVGTFSYGIGYHYLGMNLTNKTSLTKMTHTDVEIGNGQQGLEVWGMKEMGPVSVKGFLVKTANNLDLNVNFLRSKRVDFNRFLISATQGGIATEYKLSTVPMSFGFSYSKGTAESIANPSSGQSQRISLDTYGGFLYYGNPKYNLTASSSYSAIQDQLYQEKKSNFQWHELNVSLQPLWNITINPSFALGKCNDLWSKDRTVMHYASATISYSQLFNSIDPWVWVAHSTSKASDGSENSRTFDALIGISWNSKAGLSRNQEKIKRTRLSFEVGYEKYLDKAYPQNSYNSYSAFLSLKMPF
jgi:hypothetical protein